MLVLIRGAGDIATGVAVRLHRCGFSVLLTELPNPTAVRRTVAFSEAVYRGTASVEGITARLCESEATARTAFEQGEPAVMIDPAGESVSAFRPDVLVDAMLAKRNLGTQISDAPLVIALGPGFTAGVDCHCVVETMRGHTLGRCIYTGSALPNTGVPGSVGGYTRDRVLYAPLRACSMRTSPSAQWLQQAIPLQMWAAYRFARRSKAVCAASCRMAFPSRRE